MAMRILIVSVTAALESLLLEGTSWLTASSMDSQMVKTKSKQPSKVIWQHRWALSHLLDLFLKHSVTVGAAVRLWKSFARSRQWIHVPNILPPSHCPIIPLLSVACCCGCCQPTPQYYAAALETACVILAE